jgi:hypothetical protein
LIIFGFNTQVKMMKSVTKKQDKDLFEWLDSRIRGNDYPQQGFFTAFEASATHYSAAWFVTRMSRSGG